MIIYKITNTVNGNIYIGQTVKTLDIRKRQHLNDALNNRGSAISNAIRKYGEDCFSWNIIDNAETVGELNEKEIYWIAHYESYKNPRHYNLTIGGKTTTGYKYTQEEKDRINDTKNSFSKERRDLWSIRQAETKGVTPFYIYNLAGEFIGEYPVASWCAKELGIGGNCMDGLLHGKRHSAQGYILVFVDEYSKELLEEKLARAESVKKGEYNPNAKITESQARQVKELISQGLKRVEIKEITGVTESIYQSIKYGYSWKHI